MSDHPLADANVAQRVAVEHHPLAAGAMPQQQQPLANVVDDSIKTLDQLADDFLSLQKSGSPILKPKSLPKGQIGIVRLRTLVERRAWGDVLKLAYTLLNEETPKHNNQDYIRVYKSLLFANEQQDTLENVSDKIKEETVEIMGLRCHALLKLRRYTELQKEVEQWKFLKQNDVNAETIEWIPWGLHILAGQSKDYAAGEEKQSTDILCHLREDILDSSWIASLDGALANCYIREGEWRLALGAIDRMMDSLPTVTKAQVTSLLGVENAELTKVWTKAYRAELLSREGRIFLQIGGLDEAKQLFAAAKTCWTSMDALTIPLPEAIAKRNTTLQVVTESMLEINDGLVHFSEGNYEQALECFAGATKILKLHAGGFTSAYQKDEWLGPSIAGCQTTSLMYHEAVNNSSLCHLYACRMHEAVETLEELVREEPAQFLTERVAFNLCTLYELGSDAAVATRKKRVLQLLAKRFFLHDIGPESFRVA